MTAQLGSSSDSSDALLAEFTALWADADALWDGHQNTPPFHSYVSADYAAVFQSLAKLRGRVDTFLEWGSGLGVVTIMASRMGFEAYGIEAEFSLVEHAERLATSYSSTARFANGTFVPEGFEWDPSDGGECYRSLIERESAYDELRMELRDFDLVYAYPWPDEHALYHKIMREFGGHRSLLLTYDAREGIALTRNRRRS